MPTDIRKIRPLRDDVVLVLIPERTTSVAGLYFKEDSDNNPVQRFEVIATGPDTTQVKAGDTVLCSWMKITEPTEGILDGKTTQFGITSQVEILAVL